MKINLAQLAEFLKSGDWQQLAHALPGESIKPVMNVLATRREGQEWLAEHKAQENGATKNT